MFYKYGHIFTHIFLDLCWHQPMLLSVSFSVVTTRREDGHQFLVSHSWERCPEPNYGIQWSKEGETGASCALHKRFAIWQRSRHRESNQLADHTYMQGRGQAQAKRGNGWIENPFILTIEAAKNRGWATPWKLKNGWGALPWKNSCLRPYLYGIAKQRVHAHSIAVDDN